LTLETNSARIEEDVHLAGLNALTIQGGPTMSQKNMASVLSMVLLAVLIAGCIAPTPVQVLPTTIQTQLVTAVLVTPSPSLPVSQSVPTPPIADWLVEGIPSDLVITYTYGSHYDYSDIVESIRITGDGHATRKCCTRDSPQRYEGQLSAEALKRVVKAFEENRFFNLKRDWDGCYYDDYG